MSIDTDLVTALVADHVTEPSPALAAGTTPTQKCAFLDHMQKALPWSQLLGWINGRVPFAGTVLAAYSPLAMLKLYLLAQWYGLSSASAAECLTETPLYAQFAGFDLDNNPSGALPDETAIRHFRLALDEYQLAHSIATKVKGALGAKGWRVQLGVSLEPALQSAVPTPSAAAKAACSASAATNALLAKYRAKGIRLSKLRVSAKPQLSTREQQVLLTIAQGFRQAEIAELLAVSLSSIQTYVRRIYVKLGVHSSAEALFEARHLGLVA